ncbi:hypothetical protein POM88_054538 [Heracleum sosnowskyi]|uniref:DUF4219 domain-containing protein n=1 Tax=Heracleum sosnowskyi TaxID=360622 RepID=A0AAD8GML7_9APIA|nr:hypothetical protein POM88_054538 [Heracleum sosnowskyi]
MVKKDAGVKIPVLDKDNYFHWKVKMHLHLMSMDERYVDCIEKGPHVPMKFASRVGLPDDAPDVEIPKLVSEWTIEDVAEVHKDKRTMNILFNGLEQEMFDNVINCTIKEKEEGKFGRKREKKNGGEELIITRDSVVRFWRSTTQNEALEKPDVTMFVASKGCIKQESKATSGVWQKASLEKQRSRMPMGRHIPHKAFPETVPSSDPGSSTNQLNQATAFGIQLMYRHEWY